MINKNEVSAGFQLASSLNKDNKTFFVKKGSIVDELIKDSVDGVRITQESDLVDTIIKVSNVDDKHEEMLQDYCDRIADKVAAMIQHGIGVVLPEVKRFYKRYTEVDVERPKRSPEHFYEVSYIKHSPLADSAFMMDIFNSIKEGTSFTRSPIGDIQGIVTDKVDEHFFDTGIGYVDEMISQAIEAEGGIENIKNRIILTSKHLSDGVILRAIANDPVFNTIQTAIFMMLFYRKLASMRGEDGSHIEGLTVNAHNNYRFWSNIVKRRWTTYKKAIAEGIVICQNGTDNALDDIKTLSDPDTPPKKIVIYSESLNKLAEQCIDITALFGFIMEGGNYLTVTVNDLARDNEKYSSLWDSKIKNMTYVSRGFNVSKTKWLLKKVYSECFKESLKEAKENGVFDKDTDEEIKIGYVGDLDKSKVNQEVNKYIDSLNPSQKISLLETAIHIVAGIRYKEYPIGPYLYSYINEEGNDIVIDESGVREIISDYVARFLLDNVVVGEIE